MKTWNEAAGSQRNWFMSAFLVAVMLTELVSRQMPGTYLQYLAWALMAGVVVLAIPQYGKREIYLISVCAVLAGYGFYSGKADWITARAALEQAVFLMAFILLLGLLHEAASTSAAVREVGAFLTQQTQGRRYYALNLGTAALTVLFNIGVVSFLAPLIQKGITESTPGDPLNPIREQRQINAMLRGFCWVVIWSPTAVAPLALMELIPGVDRGVWMGYGICIFFVILMLGRLEDKLRFRKYQPLRKIEPPVFPRKAMARFFAACCWLMALTIGFAQITSDSVVSGLLMACPLMLVGWVIVQNGSGRSGYKASVDRIRVIVIEDLPRSAPLGVTLAASGFLGRISAHMLPSSEIAQSLGFGVLPDYIILASLPVLLTLISFLAFSPIMLAIFFGGFFAGLPELPADPTLLALALSCGWSLSMSTSPFATPVLLLQRIGGIPAPVLTWKWNRLFNLSCALTMYPVFWVLCQF